MKNARRKKFVGRRREYDTRRSLANMMKNDRRKKFVGRRREDDTRRSGDERTKNGDGGKKRELEGQKR